MSVVVYILSSDPHSDRVKQVRRLFSAFSTQVVNIPSPGSYDYSNGLGPSDKLEIYQYKWCLDDAASSHPNKNLIVVRDNTTSMASPEDIRDGVEAAVEAGGWDLFYLCKWMDRCDLYSEPVKVGKKPWYMVSTKSPFGTQAVMFTPKGRDWVRSRVGRAPLSSFLNEAVDRGYLKASCYTKNLVECEVSHSSSNEYYKLNQCRDTSSHRDDSVLSRSKNDWSSKEYEVKSMDQWQHEQTPHEEFEPWTEDSGKRKSPSSSGADYIVKDSSGQNGGYDYSNDCNRSNYSDSHSDCSRVEQKPCHKGGGYSISYYAIVVILILLVIVGFSFYKNRCRK